VKVACGLHSLLCTLRLPSETKRIATRHQCPAQTAVAAKENVNMGKSDV
jgi:hypothetical protein